MKNKHADVMRPVLLLFFDGAGACSEMLIRNQAKKAEKTIKKTGRPMIDCLLIGYNDGDFDNLVQTLRSMGPDHPDFRDLNINFIEYNGKPYRALDILDHFYYEGHKRDGCRPFHNADLLWNVIMYLGTCLARNGFSFDYVNLFQYEKNKLREKLQNNEIMTVVITTTVYTTVDPILEVRSFIRTYNDKAKIIVGGPFLAKQAEQMGAEELQLFFSYIKADFFVLSREGEQTLINILRSLKGNGKIEEVRNIAYKHGDKYFVSSIENENNILQENMIDYSLFPRKDIGEFINVRISKGCPYKCAYCGFPVRSEKYQVLSVAHIQKELDAISKVGTVKSLFFMDDSVNVPKNRFREMLRMMIRQQYDFSWNCFLRCDSCDEETIELMKEARCEGVFLGLESANETLLRNMNKTSRKQDFLRTVPLFKKAGMNVFVSTFIGFPGETYETYKETQDFLREIEPDFYRHQLWYCDPATPIWQQREKYGLKGFSFGWSHNTMTVKQACDLIEDSFLTLDTPVWAPDPGYNFISVYYLKHRGMPIDRQKHFLRSFNAIVKEKILNPYNKTISPKLLSALRESCQFDRSTMPDMAPINALSGSRYEKAIIFWDHEIEEVKQRTEQDYERAETAAINNSSRQIFERTFPISINLGDDQRDDYLLFIARFILNLKGHNRISILLCLDGFEKIVPLSLKLTKVITADEIRHRIKEKIKKSQKFSRFGMHILTKNRKYENVRLPFEAGFILGITFPPEDLWQRYQKVTTSLGLIANLDFNNGQGKLRIYYLPGSYERAYVENTVDSVISCFQQTKRGKTDRTGNHFYLIDSINADVLKEFSSKEFNFQG